MQFANKFPTCLVLKMSSSWGRNFTKTEQNGKFKINKVLAYKYFCSALKVLIRNFCTLKFP